MFVELVGGIAIVAIVLIVAGMFLRRSKRARTKSVNDGKTPR
jgi:septation ring formation regulator EzrA